jgi:hypothetical protein
MAPRVSLPGEFHLDAIIVDPVAGIRQAIGQDRGRGDWAQPSNFDDAVIEKARKRGPYIALRWVLNTALGMPLEPFTVWRRHVSRREAALPIPNISLIGDTFWWDGLTEMMRIELDVTTQVKADGLSRADHDPVATTMGGPGTIALEGGPMIGVRVSTPSAVTFVRGLSLTTMANGSGWTAIERVGLPLDPSLEAASYYDARKQGPLLALTDPVSAAVERLDRWGPVFGWVPLLGLPPWIAPNSKALVAEFSSDLLPDLIAVLQAFPPPNVDGQRAAERPPRPLSEFAQVIGANRVAFGGAGQPRSEIITRPLQMLATGVASDTWASLVLGFGTGAEIGERTGFGGIAGITDDFMVTAPWRGLVKVAVQSPWPWPWGGPPPVVISQEVDRELVAIVLSPRLRTAPLAPNPVGAAPTYVEGAPTMDAPFTSSVKVETPRSLSLPGQSRTSGYGLARYDKPNTGTYRLRQRPKAKGWIPIGSIKPARDPGQETDPALTDGLAMLRDNGVPLPISGTPLSYQYAVAATDLFGQWSPWSTAWLSAGPAGVQVPIVTICRARAKPGPGGTDPCELTATTEIVWDASERSCSRLHVVVDVFDPFPSPPSPLANPPDTPQPGWNAADVTVTFDVAGIPTAVPAGVIVTPLHPDDTAVTMAAPFVGDERRYRIEWSTIPVTYGAAHEKAVVVYAQAEERVRPGEWSGWSHAKEMVIAPNPIPPPVPVPLPPEYPLWASLPNAAGISFAPVEWSPTGAWRYRVYEATEAALLTACGKPGPVLTRGFGARMQDLFNLHKIPANLLALKAAYRKLGTEPIIPPVQANGKMRYEAWLPRGSQLIHCFIVVGVSETNTISGWPVPDGDGRKGFFAFAIPEKHQPPMPEIETRVGSADMPEITVRCGGAVPVSSLRIYRASHPVLARDVGTMSLITELVPPAASWRETKYTDSGASRGWNYLQYRAVAAVPDDPDKAAIAVSSTPSKAFSLLFPPAEAPALALAELAVHSTLTTAVVKVSTDAPHRAVPVGDFFITWVKRQVGAEPERGATTLSGMPDFASVAALMASSEGAGYVGGTPHLRLTRTGGQPLALSVDLKDPLGRTSHVLLDVAEFVPDPVPEISQFSVVRHNTPLDRAVWIAFECNAPSPVVPEREWKLSASVRAQIGGIQRPIIQRTFNLSTVPAVASEGDVPKPRATTQQWMAARIAGTGRFVLWVRANFLSSVSVTLTNSNGQFVTRRGTTT